MSEQARVIFSKKDIETIAAALPQPLKRDGRQKLEALLRTWAENDLAEHLLPGPSKKINKQRTDRILKAGRLAQKLQAAITELTEDDRAAITLAMTMSEVAPPPAETEKTTQWAAARSRLSEEPYFLAELAEAASKAVFLVSRRNNSAYLVMLDAAAIFEFVTGTQPTRVVDRVTHQETGPFWRFLEVLWPMIFGNGTRGLRAAMQNWYRARSLGEASALIANMRLRRRW